MKTLFAMLVALLLWGCATSDFHQYTGAQQNWPTASGAFVSNKYDVPAYYGLPSRPYIVLGSLDVTTEGRRAATLPLEQRMALSSLPAKLGKWVATPLSCKDMAKFKRGQSQWRTHLQTAATVAASPARLLGITSTGKLTIADVRIRTSSVAQWPAIKGKRRC